MTEHPQGTEIISQDARRVRLRMTPFLWSVFIRNRISFGTRTPANILFVDLLKSARIEAYSDLTNGTILHSMGAFSFTRAGSTALDIGRYCSIADQTNVMGERHPIEHVTSSSFPYLINRPAFVWAREDLLEGSRKVVLPTKSNPPCPVLHHDVWTGNHVILARGITLHTGCVIGAGAVVVKDVPPYAIVGGNPARVIRLRFPERIIERLLESRWWDRHPSVLLDHDITDPERFLDQLAASAPRPPFAPSVFGWSELQKLLVG